MKIPNQCITETFYDNDESTIMTNLYCFKTNHSNTYKYMNPLEKTYLSEDLYDNLIRKASISKSTKKHNRKNKTKKESKKEKRTTKQTKKKQYK